MLVEFISKNKKDVYLIFLLFDFPANSFEKSIRSNLVFALTQDSYDLDLTQIQKVNKWRKKQHYDTLMLD